jgi:hypothetical protein
MCPISGFFFVRIPISDFFSDLQNSDLRFLFFSLKTTEFRF